MHAFDRSSVTFLLYSYCAVIRGELNGPGRARSGAYDAYPYREISVELNLAHVTYTYNAAITSIGPKV